MEPSLSIKKGKVLSISLIIVMIGTALFVYFFKNLFVEETGKISFSSPLIILLTIGVYYGVDYCRSILGVLLTFLFFYIGTMIAFFPIDNKLPFLGLLGIIGVMSYIINFSKDLKAFYNYRLAERTLQKNNI